jgi:hypothetical protein
MKHGESFQNDTGSPENGQAKSGTREDGTGSPGNGRADEDTELQWGDVDTPAEGDEHTDAPQMQNTGDSACPDACEPADPHTNAVQADVQQQSQTQIQHASETGGQQSREPVVPRTDGMHAGVQQQQQQSQQQVASSSSLCSEKADSDSAHLIQQCSSTLPGVQEQQSHQVARSSRLCSERPSLSSFKAPLERRDSDSGSVTSAGAASPRSRFADRDTTKDKGVLQRSGSPDEVLPRPPRPPKARYV